MPRVLNYKRDSLPPGVVYVGRAMSSYGLPASNGRTRSGSAATPRRRGVRGIREYERRLFDSGLINDIHELRGKDLVCWCAPLPCHGDVLARLANN